MSKVLTIKSVFDNTRNPPLYLFGYDASSPDVGAPVFAPLIAEITQAQGCQLWLDSDFAGTTTEGGNVTEPTNRSGSNATVAPFTTPPVWEGKGWNGEQSCIHLANTTLHASGSDIAAVANGTNKAWHFYLACEFQREATNSEYFAFFDRAAGTAFANGIGMTSLTDSYFLGVNGQVAAIVDSTVQIGLEYLILDMSYSGGQVQFGINGVRAAAFSYASGVNILTDGFTIGGWNNSGTKSQVGDLRLRMAGVFDHKLTGTAQDTTILQYLRSYCGNNFKHIASLGAT